MGKLNLSTFIPKRADIYLLDAIVAGASIFLLYIAFAPPTVTIRDVAFDSAKWRAESSSCMANMAHFSANDRSMMAGDLARLLLETDPALNKQDVVQLLGEPDAYKYQRSWGYRSGASTMDCLTFDIVFDENGIISSAGQVQH